MEIEKEVGKRKAEEDFTKSNKTCKRNDAILWDDYFMAVAFLSAMRSKDPNTQVGACIVNPDKRIVGIGYNGFPRGCSDDELPWSRTAESELDTKYPYVCHAEVNAILNKNSSDVRNCTLYVALFPCNECTKVIIQSGITEVVYLSDKYKDTVSMQASRRMLQMAKIPCRQHKPSTGSITIDFTGPLVNAGSTAVATAIAIAETTPTSTATIVAASTLDSSDSSSSSSSSSSTSSATVANTTTTADTSVCSSGECACCCRQ